MYKRKREKKRWEEVLASAPTVYIYKEKIPKSISLYWNLWTIFSKLKVTED